MLAGTNWASIGRRLCADSPRGLALSERAHGPPLAGQLRLFERVEVHRLYVVDQHRERRRDQLLFLLLIVLWTLSSVSEIGNASGIRTVTSDTAKWRQKHTMNGAKTE